MKRYLMVAVLFAVLAAVAGCGDGGHPPTLVVKSILSDDTVDGDIREDVSGSLTVTQVARDNVPSVFAGIDPITFDEFRAFLDFPLAGIPLTAVIRSASLDLVIDSLTPAAGSAPLRVELVSFPPPLTGADFDRAFLPPLAFTTIVPPVTASDLGRHVVLDVTGLMRVAQANGLPRFQVRIMTDLGIVTPGLVEIDDSANATAPLLRVSYF
jgi:hypothetical protein